MRSGLAQGVFVVVFNHVPALSGKLASELSPAIDGHGGPQRVGFACGDVGESRCAQGLAKRSVELNLVGAKSAKNAVHVREGRVLKRDGIAGIE